MKSFVVIGKKFSGAQSILKGPSSDFTALHSFTVGCLEKQPDCDVVELCECLPKKAIKMKAKQAVAPPEPELELEPETEKPKTKSPNKFK